MILKVVTTTNSDITLLYITLVVTKWSVNGYICHDRHGNCYGGVCGGSVGNSAGSVILSSWF